jgi:dynein heavy chain
MLDLEEQVLDRLYRAPADILSDVELIHGLEATKATAESLADAVRTARGVEASLQSAREVRGSREGVMKRPGTGSGGRNGPTLPA